MSVSPAALIHESEEEAVVEAGVRAPVDLAARASADVTAGHEAVSRAMAAPPGVRESSSPRVGAAPKPESHTGPNRPIDLAFLESARMDREMARELHRSAVGEDSPMSITAALMNMSSRRFLVLAAGLFLLTVGLLALKLPVFLTDFDQWGFQITCGSGFESSFAQAGIADSAGTEFVDRCHTAVAVRRTWSIPLVVSGLLLLGGLLVIAPRPQSAKS